MRTLAFTAAMVVSAACAFAAEDAAKPATELKTAAELKAEAENKPASGALRVQRPGFDRAKFEERLKQRRAEQKAKVVELLKANGVADEAKANEVAEAIEKIYSRPQRPAGMRDRRPPLPGPRAQPPPAPKE